MKTILSLLFAIVATTAIAQTTTIQYTASSEDIPNPERGFYTPTITYASDYDALSVSYLQSLRMSHPVYEGNYQVATTLVFRYFVLDNFVNSAISSTFLTNMQADFDAARASGVKLIIRFSYVNEPTIGNCSACGTTCNDDCICPPYGDATKTRVLQHIAQLKPYLQANQDIIATVQMGFIGIWGENYYSDYFGDASQNPCYLTNTNWQDRNEVLTALLDAVPSKRTIQVRYPQIKQRFVYGIGAPTNSAPLTVAESYSETDKARLGFHNDCYLASDTDFGTYSDYGPPVVLDDTTQLKPYLEMDSRFVPVGGETCAANNPDDNCASVGGRADAEMRRFHYSYLNSDYNNAEVNNDWTNVCLDDIKRQLGYRLVLLDATLPNEAHPGGSISITLHVENEGYAAPFNPRGLELVLEHTTTGMTYFAPLDADPRSWLPGTHQVTSDLCLPPNIQHGAYDVYLHLPDPEPTLFDNPLYAIRLANQNMWNASTGYNQLGHTLAVNTNSASNMCDGDLTFTPLSVYDPNYCPDILDINGTVASDVYVAGDQILSTGQINAGENVYYQSGNTIELNADFEVQSGAAFLGVIKGCFGGF